MYKEEMISVIAPVYNVEKYIIDFLKSLLSQTFKNFELILVNDGTKDNSIIVAENYLKKTNISYRIINQENKGLASARNTGLRYAEGKWVVMPDTDDILQPDFLERLYEAANKFDADMVFCLFEKVNEDNIWMCSLKNSNCIIYNTDELFNSFLVRSLPLIVTALLIKLEIIIQNNIYFEEKQMFGEDAQFIWKLIPTLDKAVYVTKPMYNYRTRPFSIMTAPNTKHMIQSYFVFKNSLEDYYGKINKGISKIFLKYGVARQSLGVCHTAALRLEYGEFIKLINSIEYKRWTKELFTFPDMRIRVLSLTLYLWPRLFFLLFQMFSANGR